MYQLLLRWSGHGRTSRTGSGAYVYHCNIYRDGWILFVLFAHPGHVPVVHETKKYNTSEGYLLYTMHACMHVEYMCHAIEHYIYRILYIYIYNTASKIWYVCWTRPLVSLLLLCLKNCLDTCNLLKVAYIIRASFGSLAPPPWKLGLPFFKGYNWM